MDSRECEREYYPNPNQRVPPPVSLVEVYPTAAELHVIQKNISDNVQRSNEVLQSLTDIADPMAVVKLDTHLKGRNNPHGVTAGQIGALTAETDPTVPAWAKAPSKPAYTAAEVGAPAVQQLEALCASLNRHSSAKNNPHGVTASQVGAAATAHRHNATDIDGAIESQPRLAPRGALQFVTGSAGDALAVKVGDGLDVNVSGCLVATGGGGSMAVDPSGGLEMRGCGLGVKLCSSTVGGGLIRYADGALGVTVGSGLGYDQYGNLVATGSCIRLGDGLVNNGVGCCLCVSLGRGLCFDGARAVSIDRTWMDAKVGGCFWGGGVTQEVMEQRYQMCDGVAVGGDYGMVAMMKEKAAPNQLYLLLGGGAYDVYKIPFNAFISWVQSNVPGVTKVGAVL